MARVNYAFAKKQREQAKKQEKAAKKQRKAILALAGESEPDETPEGTEEGTEAGTEGEGAPEAPDPA